jgi:hypothetical protein
MSITITQTALRRCRGDRPGARIHCGPPSLRSPGAHQAEPDFAGWLAAVLARLAAQLGSSDAVTAGPGSWETALADQLVKGTVGHSDERLAAHARQAGGDRS